MSSFDVTTSGNKADWKVLPLDPTLYHVQDDEREFFKDQTDIQGDEELKQHVLKIQRQAYTVVPYPCIRAFSFMRFNAPRSPGYQQALTLGRTRPGAILLDVGAGFGTDTRKLNADGYPVGNTVVTDLHEGLWNAGHKLFRSTPKSYPVTFVRGDVFQLTKGIKDAPIVDRPNLLTLTSLVPLKGQVSVMYASHFFHLFDEPRCKEVAGHLAYLLSPEPGSIIFGLNLGSPEAVIKTTPTGSLYCHSPATWTKMWEACFTPGTIKVEAEVVKGVPRMSRAFTDNEQEKTEVWLLNWCVERL